MIQNQKQHLNQSQNPNLSQIRKGQKNKAEILIKNFQNATDLVKLIYQKK